MAANGDFVTAGFDLLDKIMTGIETKYEASIVAAEDDTHTESIR